MIDKALAPYLVDNFTKAYKDYLIKKVFGNKKLFDEQFGEKYIQSQIEKIENEKVKSVLKENLKKIEEGERDFRF